MNEPDGLQLLPAGDRIWDGRVAAACDSCGRIWLVHPSDLGDRCGCGRSHLEEAAGRVPSEPPEQRVEVVVRREGLIACLLPYLERVRFREKGLSAADLADRAVLVWWPRWLVDATVQGAWSAEVGFEYEAQSTVEHYRGGSWQTEQQVDVRVRWEGRTGTLSRRYDNVVVPALIDEGPVGLLEAASAEACDTPGLPEGRLLLPDCSPSEVWAGAEEAFRGRAAIDLQRASGGQHVRAVHLEPSFEAPNWTVRIYPMWWTSYTGGDGEVHTMLVDAVSGRPWGPVFASTKQAWGLASAIAGGGVLVLLLSALLALSGLLVPPLLVLAAIVGVVGVGLIVGALVPVASVWSWNKSQLGMEVGRRWGASRRLAP